MPAGSKALRTVDSTSADPCRAPRHGSALTSGHSYLIPSAGKVSQYIRAIWRSRAGLLRSCVESLAMVVLRQPGEFRAWWPSRQLCFGGGPLRGRLSALLSRGWRRWKRPTKSRSGFLSASLITRRLCPRLSRRKTDGRSTLELPPRSGREGIVFLSASQAHA